MFFVILCIGVAIGLGIYLKNNGAKAWEERINNNLSGELGRKLKEYIYPNSEIYRVYDHAILFYDAQGNERVIGFSQFGYDNIPVTYTNIVCDWLRRSVINDKTSYIMEPMVHTFELYEEGTSDQIRVRGSLFGYTVDKIPGNPGKWVDKKSMMGYMLYHKSKQDYYSNVRKKLKKW